MKHVKLFEQFINESSEPHNGLPIQIVMRGFIGLTGKEVDLPYMEPLYDKYIRLVLIKGYDEYNHKPEVPDNRRLKIDYRYPILNQTSNVHAVLKDPRAVVHQPLESFQISKKDMFHKAFADADFVPKAVFKLAEIEKLKLPIIAKPSDSFSAQGIEIFDTYEAARKSKLEFDIWSEAKDLKTEFRAFVFDGRIIHISERIDNMTKSKAVGKKKPEEKIDLVYIDQEMETFPYLTEVQRIVKEISKKVDLLFWCVDLMLDSDGKLWVPEINGAPGVGPGNFYDLYKEWVPYAYGGRNLPPEDVVFITDITNRHRKTMKEQFPKEYASSLNPIKA